MFECFGDVFCCNRYIVIVYDQYWFVVEGFGDVLVFFGFVCYVVKVKIDGDFVEELGCVEVNWFY